MIGQDYFLIALFIIAVSYLIHGGNGHSLRR